MTRQDAKANGIQTVWVLRMAWADRPAQYLRDFRHGSSFLWSADVREADIFIRAVDAEEMARRISWLLRMPVEVVRSPVDPDEMSAATCGDGLYATIQPFDVPGRADSHSLLDDAVSYQLDAVRDEDGTISGLAIRF